MTVYCMCGGCGRAEIGERVPADWPCRRTPACWPTAADPSKAGLTRAQRDLARVHESLRQLRAALNRWMLDATPDEHRAYRDVQAFLDRKGLP